MTYFSLSAHSHLYLSFFPFGWKEALIVAPVHRHCSTCSSSSFYLATASPHPLRVGVTDRDSRSRSRSRSHSRSRNPNGYYNTITAAGKFRGGHIGIWGGGGGVVDSILGHDEERKEKKTEKKAFARTTTTMSPSRSLLSSSSSSALGRIWNAEEAVQAWCLTKETRTTTEKKTNKKKKKSKRKAKDEEDDGRLISWEEDSGIRVRIMLRNLSDNQDLVYSWITPKGKLYQFQWLRHSKNQNNNNNNNKAGNEDSASFWSPLLEWLPFGGSQQPRARPRRHVIKSFVGHAFVFGKLRPEQQQQQQGQPKINLKDLKDLKDIIVLGAYRPEQTTLKQKKRDQDGNAEQDNEEDDDEDDDDDEFPTHVVTLQPPATATWCGLRSCSTTSQTPPSPPTTTTSTAVESTVAVVDGNSDKASTSTTKTEADKNDDVSSPAPAWLYYDVDPTWTIHVDQVHYSSSSLLSMSSKNRIKMHFIDTTKTKKYRRTTLCDWPVYLDKEFDVDKNDNDDDGDDNDGGDNEDDGGKRKHPSNSDNDDQKNNNNKREKKKTKKQQQQEWLQIFQEDLQYALDHIPEHAKTQLRAKSCCLWINDSFEYGPPEAPEPCTHLCFHPYPTWLKRNRMHIKKLECVEVYDLQEYCCNDRDQWGPGGVLIHELSHAYHHLCLPNGYENADIQACYEQAMEEGLYDCVRVHGHGAPTAKAYACTDAMEYFAELSTAFLGGVRRLDTLPPKNDQTNNDNNSNNNNNNNNDDNDDKQNNYNNNHKQELSEEENGEDEYEEYNKWYPFNRSQIKKHDPRAYVMLQKVWKMDLS